MHGFGVFLGKEFREIVRTWRLWVLPSLFVFVGLSSPVLAKLTPKLLESVAGGQQGVTVTIPDPTTIDAYLQFSKNVMQMVLIAVIIIAAGLIAAERKSGTAVLVLTKPVSRPAFVVAKFVANWVLVAGSTLLGAALCFGVTAAIFDTSVTTEFARATGVWLVFAGMVVAVMTLLSTLIGSQAGAAGAGVGFYLIISIMSAWGPLRDYSPAGLVTAGDRLMLGQPVVLVWPLAGAVVLAVVAVAAAALVFQRQEL
jgi:ABC-2 type transport system permease protein